MQKRQNNGKKENYDHFQVSASDPDCGVNAMVNYTLGEGIKKMSEFEVRSATGEICISTALDFETRNSFEFPVLATDRGGLSTTAMVKIQLADVNDNRPVFYPREYNVSLRESDIVKSTSTPVVAVVATDADSGRFGTVYYRIVAGNEENIFRINRNTGEIFISEPNKLSIHKRIVYKLNISASDGEGLRTAQDAEVFISVIDSSQHAPSFEKITYNYSVKEDVSKGTVVGSVLATTSGSGSRGAVRYSIYSGDPDGYFSIDPMSGNIRIANPLDRETKPEVLLNIQATSGDPPAYGHTQVTIEIQDVNDNPPEFESSTVRLSVPENFALGIPFYEANAHDKDSGDSGIVRYSLMTIDTASVASSFGSLASSGAAPGSSSSSSSSLLFNGGSFVNHQIGSGHSSTTSTAAAASSLSSAASNLFAIDSRTGHLTLSRHLDYETSQRHALIVTATDSGKPPLSANLTILVEVQDVNDNPPVFERNEYSINVLESMPSNSQILQVTAVDLDTGNNARITYRIVGGSDQIYATGNNFSNTSRRSYNNDNGSASSSKLSGNSSGKTSSGVTTSGRGSSSRNYPPPPQHSRSDNKNMNLGAQDVDDRKTTELFGIFPNSGWIYLRGTLDRETRDRYELTVVASDNGTPPAHAKARVIVNVLDANDNDPQFTLPSYEFSIEENMRRGSVVGTVAADDADLDANAAIRYSLIPSNTSFQVNPVTGEILTREPLDRETREIYDLVAEARDQGVPYRSARVQVKITVTDVNDNAPDIVDPQEDVVSVREEQPPGTEVVRIRAVDRDNGYNASITYSILKGRDSDGYGSFTIDPMNGLIRTKVTLDHEERSIYRLAVAATDGGRPPKQTVRPLRVEVLDLNDNRPTFTSSSLIFKVREDVRIGHIVGSIGPAERSDAENLIAGSSGLHVTYTLTSLTSDVIDEAFDMDRQTGSLVVARRLDREHQSEYRLEIRALDTTASNNPQSSAITVKVEITDVNDNAPHWPEDPITIYVSETAAIGQIVYNFTATDEDAGANGEVQYHLESQMPELEKKLFSLDPLTGMLSLQGNLDYEDLNEYILVVEAVDQSVNTSERLRTKVTARILVTDSNDNSPVFVSPTADSTILLGDSAQVGQLVAHVVAVDKDAGDNGHITYSILAGNEEGRFRMDPRTGSIELAKAIQSTHSQSHQIRNSQSSASDRNSQAANKFSLVISASDHGSPVSKETHLNLQILVQGSSNNPPRFQQSTYRVNVSENAPVDSFVVRVGAKSFRDIDNVNLTYEIPPGVGDDLFAIDKLRGIIVTRGQFDRETKAEYKFPVYVVESSVSGNDGVNSNQNLLTGQFDIATVVVKITDVNDHAPEFRPGSCYPLAVPENSERSVIHSVVATDLDDGPNGEIIYSIIGGNFNNKFSIDVHTGELTAQPLDRETRSRYLLQIQAQDRGTPNTYYGHCNISVIVEDQNDNDPRFDRPKYVVNIPEDIEIGTSILKVNATDADLGINARIVYSLANETQWLFTIDNRSGLITTAGTLDREQQHVYNFMVVATDGGRSDSRSTRVPVQIIVEDVNDNKPIFKQYPFMAQVPALVQPGQTILQVSALDVDQGTNGEIVYELTNDRTAGKFRVNPNTGVVSATRSLASENGQLLRLEVTARDKGNPPQSAIGLIEIRVGESPLGTPVLRFPNESYRVSLMENTPNGRSVIQMNAVRSDGRRQKIIYSIGSGNEEGAFSIDATTGEIKVRDSKFLDFERYLWSYETIKMRYDRDNRTILGHGMMSSGNGPSTEYRSSSEIKLIIEARTDGSPLLYGYAELQIQLQDENDNGPRFTQQQYAATVWEGNNKGTFVMQVAAYDADRGANSRILYHIVDGNHDNAFVIEPAFSGIVKTNIVLDREIRDMYRLKVIATDEGVPQMTGTATIRVHIIDVNDNQPTFPPPSIVSVSEGSDLGIVITTVSANDVDSSPALTYRFAKSVDNDNFDAETMFSIDRYSGKVILKKHLDYESQQEYQFQVIASDMAHEARTSLTIRVTDVNDNPPIFQQVAYHVSLPDQSTGADMDLLTINATDADGESNSRIRYQIIPPVSGFIINEQTGAIYVNASRITKPFKEQIYLRIIAMDSGKPPLSAKSIVRIQTNSYGQGKAQFLQSQFRASINEEAELGTVVLKLSRDVLDTDLTQNLAFSIVAGNEEGTFEVYQASAIILVKSLDREKTDLYKLRLVMSEQGSPVRSDNNSTAINIFVTVEDANDNAPIFQSGRYETEISESAPIRSSVTKIVAIDKDLENSPNSEVVYDITSGNDAGMFSIDLVSGILFVKNPLDYDVDPTPQYDLIIRACDSGLIPRCSLTPYRITLTDENDNEPKFPVTEYLEFVGENEPIGTSVFTARATDMDRGQYGMLNYTIESSNGYPESNDAWKLFRIDPNSGVVTTNAVFDYEQRSQYSFIIKAFDLGGKSAKARARIMIDSRDEFSPQFTERTYRFILATGSSEPLPIGYVVGQVTATDRDKGPDGRVVYQLNNQHNYFKINRTTGAIMIKKKIDNDINALSSGQEISFVVTASSGRQGSLTNMSVVEISLDPLADPGTNLASSGGGSSGSSGGIADWALGLLISLLLVIFTFAAVFLFLHMRNRRHKQVSKPSLSTETVGNSNSYVDPSAFDTIPIRGNPSGNTSGGQFAPPKYDEIPPYGQHTASSNSGAATTSELSGSEQSGSSGRGSAEDGEDGEDEEIRMINEGPMHRDHHRGDDGRLSDISVQNTQEYLARLGIVDNTNTTGAASTSSRHCSESISGSNKDALLHHPLPIDSLHMFDEEPGEADITNLIYAKLNDVTGGSDRASSADEAATTAGSIGAAVDHVMGFGDVPVVGNGNPGPAMNGSLSSIVHSEEELTGSYNWDYLLDWGPQYQPLAHVFSEIARLKDDTLSVHSGNSAASSAKSKQSLQHSAKHIPPPLLTNVAPRSINVPVLSSRGSTSHHSAAANQYLLPRSPISHDAPGGFSTSSAMSPSFSPSLSPLATRSPSISPHVVTTGVPTSHHMVSLPRHQPQPAQRKNLDSDMRVRM
ncbi:unnamed protein product [Hermetia illucens]|uniref:Cadherin domain-containing protein n=1 Tax=Hermetia illucens TaxID=343691 RepID=A0A7R8UDY6_HERIL|nr:unnamed protein product [Hermetia illucens]